MPSQFLPNSWVFSVKGPGRKVCPYFKHDLAGAAPWPSINDMSLQCKPLDSGLFRESLFVFGELISI